MAVTPLRRLALRAPAPVHAAIGADAWRAVDDLALSPEISLEASVRHAAILLVAGGLREDDLDDLRRLHDQMPHPRATVFWQAEPGPGFPDAAVIEAERDPAEAIGALHRRLIMGETPSEPDLQPDEPPNPWRGRGDHGQGGEGMMGGTPYGRPMAMTAEDLRDGLALDAFSAEIGPFLPVLPPGLKLAVTLQGDVIQTASVLRPPFPQSALAGPAGRLRLIARQLRLVGLGQHAVRLLRAASALDRGEETDVARLRRLVEWSGALLAIPRGLGVTGGADVRGRLSAWWDEAGGRTADSGRPDLRLVALLPGLEWNEAALVINSFDPTTLIGMCPDERGDVEDHGPEEHGHHPGHHGEGDGT